MVSDAHFLKQLEGHLGAAPAEKDGEDRIVGEDRGWDTELVFHCLKGVNRLVEEASISIGADEDVEELV